MAREIITISRQYGSGGREIGERVASSLGYKYYDKELIRRLANKGAVDEEFAKAGSEGIMGRLSCLFLQRGSEGVDEDSLPLLDRMFLTQARLIKQIALEGPCVIVGHCADYFLEGYQKTLNVFVHAEWESRVQRVMLRNNISYADAVLRIKKVDRHRASFYEQYTDRKWGNAENYDISCSSSAIGIDELVGLIVSLAGGSGDDGLSGRQGGQPGGQPDNQSRPGDDAPARRESFIDS
jgi:cytidylate kinase